MRDCSEDLGEEPGYVQVLQQKLDSQNIKRLMLIKGNQISQVSEFSTFLWMIHEFGLIGIIPLMYTLTI